MNSKNPNKEFYMLDKNDITNVKGIVTAQHVMDELELLPYQFNNFLTRSNEYKDCILVEVEDDNNDGLVEHLLAESDRFSFKWYKNIVFYVCIKQKCINAVTMYAKHFLGANDDDWVTIESDTFDITKIKIKSKYERYSVAKKQVGLFDQDKLIKKYDSEKQCSKDLYLAESTLNSYLKGNVKNPMYDLRYL